MIKLSYLSDRYLFSIRHMRLYGNDCGMKGNKKQQRSIKRFDIIIYLDWRPMMMTTTTMTKNKERKSAENHTHENQLMC